MTASAAEAAWPVELSEDAAVAALAGGLRRQCSLDALGEPCGRGTMGAAAPPPALAPLPRVPTIQDAPSRKRSRDTHLTASAQAAPRSGSAPAFAPSPTKRVRDALQSDRDGAGLGEDAELLKRLASLIARPRPWNPALLRAIVRFKQLRARAVANLASRALDAPSSPRSTESATASPRRRSRRRREADLLGAVMVDSAAEKLLLRQRLDNLGLGELVMVGDGNCQFRSAAHELFGRQSRHEEVRARVCDHVAAHESEFAVLFESKREFARYLTRMRRPGVWGDEITLRAMADSFGVRIHVLTSSRGFGSFYLQYSADADSSSAVGHDHKQEPAQVPHLFFTYLKPVHYNVLTLRDSPIKKQVASAAMRWLLETCDRAM